MEHRLPPSPEFGTGQLSLSLTQLGLRHCSVPQVVLIVSGNLSFLNWLTIVPSIACFDDATMGFLFPSGPGSLKDQVLKMQKEEAREARPRPTYGGWTPGDMDRGFYSQPRIAGPQKCWPILIERQPGPPHKGSCHDSVSISASESVLGWGRWELWADSQAGGQQYHPQLR